MQSVPLSLTRPRQLEIRTRRSDNLPLLFGIGDTFETAQEELASVDNCEVDTKVLCQLLLNLIALIETHASIVDEDGLEAVPDGFAHQGRSYSAVHTTAAGSKDECSVTNEIPDASDLELDKVAHLPVWFSSADVNAKVAEDVGSAGCLDSNVRRSPVVMPGVSDKRVPAQGGIGRLVALH